MLAKKSMRIYRNLLVLVFISVVDCLYSEQKMSTEEQVGQLLMAHFHGKEANQDAKRLIQELHVGGIIYYNWANQLSSFKQVQNLSKSLQKLAKIPLLIAVDQEGGCVNRLQEGFTLFPSNLKIAKTNQPELSQKVAFIIGQELLSAGINMNLAPVVDINNNPDNPIIGSRSFGHNADCVTLFAKYALEGYLKAGIIACLKHFPGHGDVVVDSHQELPILQKTIEQLTELELVPFYQLAKQADSIMTAHILVPALDPENCATLSRSILTGLLREEIGFKGLVVSDSLVMQALLNNCSCIEEAAVNAINAGCDLLILGGKQLHAHSQFELNLEDIQRIHHALVQAVEIGSISRQRLEESVHRILKLKNSYSLFTNKKDYSCHIR